MSKSILFSICTFISSLSFSQSDINNLMKNQSDRNFFNKYTFVNRNESNQDALIDTSFFIELVFAVKFKKNKIDTIYTVFSNDSIKKNEKDVIRVIRKSETKWNYASVNNKIYIFHFSIYNMSSDYYYSKEKNIPIFDYEVQKKKILKQFPKCIFLENIKVEKKIADNVVKNGAKN